MQQFALASVYPRSIAWLVRLDEWDRFEEIVHYNCAMVGGYFNVIIPLTEQDSVSEEYQRFLVDYDPDLVVLAPGMTTAQQNILSTSLHPFGVIPWESVSRIATLDPWAGGTGTNVTMGSSILAKKNNFPTSSVVAVADDTSPDMSKFALVVCGDVEPREPMLQVMDDNVRLSATGYRELFLAKLLNPNYSLDDLGTQLLDTGEITSAPDRYQLFELILDEHRFPLEYSDKLLETCCRVQHQPSLYQSFIGQTATYKTIGTPTRTYKHRGMNTPSIVILVSDHFALAEAVLFWNLRASDFFVAWLPFQSLESNSVSIVKWLESDYGGSFYSMMGKGLDIVFSTAENNLDRLQSIFDALVLLRQRNYLNWRLVSYNYLEFYDYVRPFIKQERVVVAQDKKKCSFTPKIPQEYGSGEYTVILEWQNMMLPKSSLVVEKWISSNVVRGFPYLRQDSAKSNIEMLRFRITNERFLKAQISTEEPLEFIRPLTENVIETLLQTADFFRVQRSSTARYHVNFINLCGDLTDAVHYLVTSPYRELFEVLADNSNKNKLGWILDYPSKRRALHHLHLREVLSKTTPAETKSYFDTVSDELPTEALQLLEKGLLERGFQLSCTSCSYKSWYPVEHVGQTFECSRCFQTQVYNANPLWLYKIPEVIFQGFEDNMQVPLLALNYLRSASKHAFEWVPDSNVYTQPDDRKAYRNIDILCISDGKFYIGEAKSNDVIEADQFSFYEQVCKSVAIDGIVFATSQAHWNRGTQQHIDNLRTWFEGEIIVLTEKELYFEQRQDKLN